ncbi:hypothetical protein FB451DRAFT_1485244 [Mycena latifolia]|nr:hypothetical protein FB451DRAFT_1485244 [Mycena latifolia]
MSCQMGQSGRRYYFKHIRESNAEEDSFWTASKKCSMSYVTPRRKGGHTVNHERSGQERRLFASDPAVEGAARALGRSTPIRLRTLADGDICFTMMLDLCSGAMGFNGTTWSEHLLVMWELNSLRVAVHGARGSDTWGCMLGSSIGRFFSRSTLAASALASFAAGLALEARAFVSSVLADGGGGGAGWMRILDLARGLRRCVPCRRSRPPRGARDGTSVVVMRQDGFGAGLYELRRRRIAPLVEGVVGARNGRFVRDGEGVPGLGGAMHRRKCTHSYGCAARGAGGRGRRPAAPLTVAFVPPLPSLVSPAPPSPSTLGAQSGVQDVLVFDPADGVLSLRRMTVALEAAPGAGLPISVSLPAGRLVTGTSMSASPPAYAASYARGHHHATADAGACAAEVAPGAELGGRNWHL